MNNPNTSVLAILFFITSCTQELFLPFSGQEPALTIVARFSDRDTVHYVYLSVSTGPNLISPTCDSSVKVYNNNLCIAQTDSIYTNSNEPWIQKHELNMTIEPGGEYYLQVSSEKMNAFSFAKALPRYSGRVSVIDYSSNTDEDGYYYYDNIKICFQDNPSDNNYYLLSDRLDGIIRYWKDTIIIDSCHVNNLGTIKRPIYHNGITTELGLETDISGSGLFIFSDSSFSDNCFYVNTDFTERPLIMSSWSRFYKKDTYDRITISAILQLGMVTKDEYDYIRLLNSREGSLIKEPVILPNNIIDGFGHFGIVTVSDIDINLPTSF